MKFISVFALVFALTIVSSLASKNPPKVNQEWLKANQFKQISNTESAFLSAYAKAKLEFIKKFPSEKFNRIEISDNVHEAWQKQINPTYFAVFPVTTGSKSGLLHTFYSNATFTLTSSNEIVLNSFNN